MAEESRDMPVPGLAAARKQAYFPQEESARRSGIGRVTISRLEGVATHIMTPQVTM